MSTPDPELMSILSRAMKNHESVSKAKAFARANAVRQCNRAEFERRFQERMSATQHSVRTALNDEPLDAVRFRHWWIHMRFTKLPDCIAEWRRMIDLDILNKEELRGD